MMVERAKPELISDDGLTMLNAVKQKITGGDITEINMPNALEFLILARERCSTRAPAFTPWTFPNTVERHFEALSMHPMVSETAGLGLIRGLVAMYFKFT